jgi:carbon monoxide dehydrogenase subunit G
MAGFKRSVVIDRPIEEVFDFATDLTNAPVFMPSCTKTELITEGGMKAGAKFKETRAMNGKERTAVIEIVEHQRPAVHSARAGMMGFQATYIFRFFPEGTGTRVELEAVVTGNFLWWLFLDMMARMMEKEDGEFLNRLRNAMQPKPATT